jgi:hypothetical protein
MVLLEVVLNEIEGSVCAQLEVIKKSFITKAGQIRIVPATFEGEKILGARLVLQLLKDKLFFFGNKL